MKTILSHLKPTFVKLAPGSPQKMSKKAPILETFRTISPKQAWWPPNFFLPIWVMTIQLHVQKNVKMKSVWKYNKIEKYWHELIVYLDLVTITTIFTWIKLYTINTFWHKHPKQMFSMSRSVYYFTFLYVSRFLNIWFGIPKDGSTVTSHGFP